MPFGYRRKSKMFVQSVLIVLLFHTTAWAYSACRDFGPTPPTDDAFYTPPDDFEATALGSILRQRTVPFPIANDGHPLDLNGSYQILYHTTDTFGNATATVTTLLVPHNADNSKLLSYQVAEDSAYLNCAPSYGLQLNSKPGASGGGEILFIEAALQQGWFVAIPDHEGPKAAFLANIRGGQAVLDGIRAVHSSGSFTGIATDPRTVMWGYSGGSMVTGFAAELQPSYAPQLDLAGAALGGTVPNISSNLPLINKSLFAGLFPPGVLGLSHEYPEFAAALDNFLVPEKRDEFKVAENQCTVDNVKTFVGQDMMSYFVDLPSVITKFRPIFDANTMGQHAPQVPLYVYKGIQDGISSITDTDKLVQSYCDSGSSVTYKRDILANHLSMTFVGAPDALIFLKERLDGRDAKQSACVVQNVISSLTDPSTFQVLGEALIQGLLDKLEDLVGPGQ
jgi:hypothetical protein